MGERGNCALFRELKICSDERYGFEGVQLIELVTLFLFQMTVIPAVERKFAELPNTNLDEKVRQVENEIIPFWNRFCSPPFAMMVLQSRFQR